MDEGDFDDEKEQRLIISLTEHQDNPVVWQAQCIALWKQLVEAAAENNSQHPSRQRTVREQYPDLVRYLAEGAPEGTDSVLTLWEVEMGKPDLKNMIAMREVLYMARLEQERGRHDMDPVLEQYIMAGEEEVEPAEEAKPVPRQGVPVLYYEKGLLQTVLERADYGESDLLDKNHTLFLKDLTDQQVYNNTCLLEQVTDLVHRKTTKQLPEVAWEALRQFEFGEGEEVIRMLCEYLESANGRNAGFLEQLRKEGVRRQMLQNLNEMGAVLAQAKPIASSLQLLMHMLALIMACGTDVYSAVAVQEAEHIQAV